MAGRSGLFTRRSPETITEWLDTHPILDRDTGCGSGLINVNRRLAKHRPRREEHAIRSRGTRKEVRYQSNLSDFNTDEQNNPPGLYTACPLTSCVPFAMLWAYSPRHARNAAAKCEKISQGFAEEPNLRLTRRTSPPCLVLERAG